MRTAFLGDIHGNRYALEACLRHTDRLGVDGIICLGDLVGWLPFGDKTLRRLRELDLPTVAGNHDLLVAGLFTDHPHQVDRMQASAFNAGLLSTVPGALDYLLGLPLALEFDGFTVVHHSPFHLPPPGEPPTIHAFNYLDTAALAQCLPAWARHPKRCIFSGHDHVPAVFELPATAHPPRLEDVIVHRPPADRALTLALSPASRYWIKAGSVGGPYRDGIAVANTVLYDSDADTLTLFRLPYPTANLVRDLEAQRYCTNLPTLRKYMDLLRRSGTAGAA